MCAEDNHATQQKEIQGAIINVTVNLTISLDIQLNKGNKLLVLDHPFKNRRQEMHFPLE